MYYCDYNCNTGKSKLLGLRDKNDIKPVENSGTLRFYSPLRIALPLNFTRHFLTMHWATRSFTFIISIQPQYANQQDPRRPHRRGQGKTRPEPGAAAIQHADQENRPAQAAARTLGGDHPYKCRFLKNVWRDSALR